MIAPQDVSQNVIKSYTHINQSKHMDVDTSSIFIWLMSSCNDIIFLIRQTHRHSVPATLPFSTSSKNYFVRIKVNLYGLQVGLKYELIWAPLFCFARAHRCRRPTGFANPLSQKRWIQVRSNVFIACLCKQICLSTCTKKNLTIGVKIAPMD